MDDIKVISQDYISNKIIYMIIIICSKRKDKISLFSKSQLYIDKNNKYQNELRKGGYCLC